MASSKLITQQQQTEYKSDGCAEVQFHINGKHFKVKADEVSIYTKLNTFIRQNAQLSGTKFMCLEGGCGACIVTAHGKHPVTKQYRSWAINSCLTPVYSCDGLFITTIEGVGNKKDGYDAIQNRLAAFNGTQCGFCSPGMVMNMHSLLAAKNGKVTMSEIENSFGGNICRCTGYRPILDAFKSLAIDADPKYKKKCPDIEDLPKLCPKTEIICNGNCTESNRIRITFADGKQWHKPNTLKDLFNVFSETSSRDYQLVAGNTAHGVYRTKASIDVFIDINDIEELHEHNILENEITLGGNLSLTDTMNIFEKVSKRKGFEYCSELRRHIDLIANVPVRNAGTLAGNLSIKHEHNEFPSDLFLILATVGAELVICDEKSSIARLRPEEYLKTIMTHKIILKIVLKSLPTEVYIYRSYKIMPRAQNAHAYVNAAFLIEMNNETIENASICFGGINPSFMHAVEVEKFLKNKILLDPSTVKEAVKLLTKELQPDWSLPDATPEYRRGLAISLFYKFILSCPNDKLDQKLKLGGNILERPLSSGEQYFNTDKNKWPLNQPVQKIEGLVQCSGEAHYVNDVPRHPGELWAVFVPATEVHATIVNIDASEALKIPGIDSFISAKDIPGINTFTPTNMMMMSENEEIFCDGIVRYHGQPVGIILGETLELATQASQLVKISYENSNNKIYPTIKEIYANKATDRYLKNTVNLMPKDKKLKTDGISFDGHFEIAGQYHFTIEPQTAVCIPIEDGIELYSASQWIDLVQAAVSKCCKISENSITLPLRRVGGGYGGKISRCSQIACACALGTILTNRPVRLVMSLEANMEIVGKRFGLISDYEVVVDEFGKIQKLINNFVQDQGCSINEQPIGNTKDFFRNCYYHDNWKVEGKCVLSDSASNTWCRAPGTTEGIAMIENIMEHIARVTRKDPIDVRMANIPDDNKIKELMPAFLEQIDYKSRKAEIEKFNESYRWRKKGIAVVPMMYRQGFFGSIPVIVSILHTDGTVAITHGGCECGQGINTKVVQVAAKTLNISMDYIKVKPSVNYITANSGITGGSMTSEAVCYATMKACETLLERIKPIRDKMKKAEWHEITDACYSELIELSCTHMYKATDVQPYITWGLSCAEMEVDILTGNFQLNRVDILEDTGESMSPNIDVGQIEGAFVMGLGYWLTEQLIYNETGKLMTNRSWNYKPPGAKDIPIDFRISFLPNSPNPLSILRSKATGEPAFCMSIVAIFALRNAIESARCDAGLTDEWISLGAPTTPEHVFLATGTKPEMLIL